MKYKHELIGKKVLIICDSNPSYKRICCAYLLGEIFDFDTIKNRIIVRLIDTGISYNNLYNIIYSKLGTATLFEFKLNTNDPFDDNNCYKDDIFAYRNPYDYNKLWWFAIYIGNNARKLIQKDLNEIKDKSVYDNYFLSQNCLEKYKSKNEYLTYLLNELNE